MDHDGLEASYLALVTQAVPWVAEACGGAYLSLPRVRVVDRRQFVDIHLAQMRRILATVPPAHRFTLPIRALGDQYTRRLLDAISSQVLGEFDPPLDLPGDATPDPPTLYIVEENLPQPEDAGASVEALRGRIIFHELAHAWQFEAHPWLHRYIDRQRQRTLEAGRAHPLQLPGATLRGLRAGVQLQAAMSFIEGHANFIQGEVNRRRDPHGGTVVDQDLHPPHFSLDRLLFAVTGGGMKMRQYRAGEAFVERVAKIGGVDLVNQAWTRPWTLPTILELSEPDRWDARMTSSTG